MSAPNLRTSCVPLRRQLAIVAFSAFLGCASAPPMHGQSRMPVEDLELLRASCNGGSTLDVGHFEVTSSTYPCEILRTYAAIEATEGRGWLMGSVPRFFLKMRLVTKGIFAGVAGLVGLG